MGWARQVSAAALFHVVMDLLDKLSETAHYGFHYNTEQRGAAQWSKKSTLQIRHGPTVPAGRLASVIRFATTRKGRPGLKMRRGLGTTIEAEADAMVAEMNEILGDQSWWSASKRTEAELRFSKPVIEAFFDEIQAGKDDPEALRERYIRLPNKTEDGYSRVLFVGTTGGG